MLKEPLAPTTGPDINVLGGTQFEPQHNRIWTVETLRPKAEIEEVIRTNSMVLITGRSNPELARAIGNKLGLMVDEPVTVFADGETNPEGPHNMRKKRVIVIQPTSRIIDKDGHIVGSVNDSVEELCLMINMAKLSDARDITAVVPYYGYARGDQKNKSRVPIAAALIARQIKSAGAHRIVTMDIHAEQTMGSINRPWDNVYARPELLEELERMQLRDITVVAADAGGFKRALAFKNLIAGSELAVAFKNRPVANEAEILSVVGDLEGRDVVIPEDLIDTAGTAIGVAEAVKKCGARRVYLLAAHGLFSFDKKKNKSALQKIDESEIDGIIITDSIKQPPEVVNHPRIRIVSVADKFAELILRIQTGESVGSMIPSINGKKH